MPTYIIEGKTIRAAKPLTDAEIDYIANDIRSRSEEGKRGPVAGLARGARQMASTGLTAIESLGDAEQAALRGIERGERIAEERGTGTSLEELERAYQRRGVAGATGEVLRSIPEEIAAQAPQLALTAAGAKTGAIAGGATGTALGGPAGGAIGATIGGIGGAVIPNYLQLYGEFLQRQAEEDIAAGREVDVSRATAAAAAIPATGVELLGQAVVLGRVISKKLFGDSYDKIAEAFKRGDTDKAERLAREGLLKTVAKGTAVGAAVEVPSEVVQTALERLQAGLSVTGDDALSEYGEVAYKTALSSPLGAAGRFSERRAARAEVEQKRQDALLGDQETEETETQETTTLPTGFPQPPADLTAKSLEGAPKEVKDFVSALDTPKKVSDAIQQFESRLGNLAEQIADAEGTEQDARSAGMDPVEFERSLIRTADRLNAALPYLRLRYQELGATAPQDTGPAGPVSPIPQTGQTQQDLLTAAAQTAAATPQVAQVDQALADALNIPGADTAPKDQPVTVTAPTTTVTTPATPAASGAAPTVPLTQAPSVQAPLPLDDKFESVDLPQYQEAISEVTSGRAFDIKNPFAETPTPDTVSPKSLQKALSDKNVRVSLEEARALVNRMELEGVLGKPNRSGQRPIATQRREAPRATSTATTPAATETARVEPIGGGTALPTPPTPAAGRETAGARVEGVAPVGGPATDVVAGTERVEPALGDISGIGDETDTEPKITSFRRGPVPSTPVMTSNEVAQAANETVQGWTNAPDIVVLDDENDTRIPNEVKKELKPDSKGFYHRGKAYVIASRASDKADVHATVFHEGLGHFGLRQKFKDRLDDILDDIYETNPATRAEADAVRMPGMTNAQAVEEALSIKSEAGPIKEAGIRAAFNRVAAFIRRIGRAMGINFNYSNNDVAQIIRIAQEKVTRGRREIAGSEKVAQAKKIQRDLLNTPIKKLEELKTISSTTPARGGRDKFVKKVKEASYDRALETLEFFKQMEDWARPAFLTLRSMQGIADVFERMVPGINNLMKIGSARVVAYREMREKIGDNINKWNRVLSDKKYQGNVINNFRDILIKSTQDQIDFRRTIKLKNGKVVPNKAYSTLDPLTARFEALPEPLRKVYFEMLDSYKEMSDSYVDLITKNLPPTAANILRREIESRRLKIYFPLYREGEYFIRYTHNNEEFVESFKNRRQRFKEMNRLEKAGVRNIQAYEKIEDAFDSAGDTTLGFFSDVNKAIDKYYKDQYGDKAQMPAQLKEAMYKLYLDSIPASSVRQQFRKREGYSGADQDPLRVYAIIATRMANQLTNLDYIPQIDEAMNAINENVAADGSMAAQQLGAELNKRADFLRNPVNNWWINKFTFVSYADYILGNQSSAVANLTNLPMIVYPMLSGEYGPRKSQLAMEDATAMYFQGGWDTGGDPDAPRKWPRSDRTLFAEGKIPKNSPLWRLYEEAINQGAIKQSTGYDIVEARESRGPFGGERGVGLRDYTGMLDYSKQALGWSFQNTERFNREVTLVAAFRLEMEKAQAQGRTGRAVERAAIDKAIRLVNEANGEALTELGPRIFQGVGALAPLKVAFTFKRYARAMYALQLRLIRDILVGSQTDTTGMTPAEAAEAKAVDREFRKVAVKQWIGTMGGAFTFAGISGLPFYGAAKALTGAVSAMSAAMFGEADDEIEDEEEDFKQAYGSLAVKGPVNQIFGVDMASRTGFSGMFWRDDPRRVDEIGLELFAVEQFLGPFYASIRTRADAIRDFYDGEIQRGMEKMLPLFARNIAKTYRYFTEGVETKDGKKIVDDLNEYETFMQFFGFTPTKISEARERAGARKEIVKRVMDRRQSLLRNAYVLWSQGDEEGYYNALSDISKWNKTRTAAEFNATINWDELEQSFKTRSRNAEEALDGVSIPKRYREGAIKRVPN
jgi:hypothetical protein